MRHKPFYGLLGAAAAALFATTSLTPTSQAQAPAPAQPAPQQRPQNILVIMGDDVGWFNIGAYHRGIMVGRTPNLDRLASEGMMFTDYYAEASCTAGRKGMSEEGGFRSPVIIRWPGHVPGGKVENGIFGANDWFPTLVAFAGNPNIKSELLSGKQIDGQTFKVHL